MYMPQNKIKIDKLKKFKKIKKFLNKLKYF